MSIADAVLLACAALIVGWCVYRLALMMSPSDLLEIDRDGLDRDE